MTAILILPLFQSGIPGLVILGGMLIGLILVLVATLKSTNADRLLDETIVFGSSVGFTGLPGGPRLAHLTTGKDLDGGTLGTAFEPGLFGLSQQGTNLGYQNMIVMAHELGHNLEACHGRAEELCTDYFFFICTHLNRTIMWPQFRNDILATTIPIFSNANQTRIRNNLVGVANPQCPLELTVGFGLLRSLQRLR